jgi:DNA-binding Xre family transcriptional regulator
MGNVVSHVPELLKEREWGPMDLVRKTTMSLDTAYRLARGEASFTTTTLEQLCKLFGVPVQEVIEYVPDEGEQPG